MMKRFLAIIPTPACSVALGFAGLGLLLESALPAALSAGIIATACPITCFVISSLICLVFLAKLLAVRGALKAIVSEAVQLAALATLPMALSLLSIPASRVLPASVALVLWAAALAGHVVILGAFVGRHVIRLRPDQVHGIWFVPFAGLAAAGISSPVHSMQAIALPIVMFALVSSALMVVLVTWRYLTRQPVPEPLRPLFCIYAAPASIVLVGYLHASPSPELLLVQVLLGFSCLFYVLALIKLIPLIIRDFVPTHAAFTFPFVISATALRQGLPALGIALEGPLAAAANLEVAIAAITCCYVLFEYLRFMTQTLRAE